MAEYFVDGINGNDANDGKSLSNAVFSITRATKLANTPGDIVYIRKGIYRESIIPIYSGTEAKPIVYKNYNGEEVIVSGTELVNRNWQVHQGNILKTEIPNSWYLGNGKEQVFINGEMVNPATWPHLPQPIYKSRNTDYATADTGSYSYDTSTGIYRGTYTNANLTTPDWTGGWALILPGKAWAGQSVQIANYSPNKIDFNFKIAPNQPSNEPFFPKDKNFYFLWGKLGAIGQGEYFWDAAQSILYLWPKDKSLDGKTVEVRTRDIGLNLNNKSYLHWEGIKFFACRIRGSSTTGITLKKIAVEYGYHDFFSPGSSLYLIGNYNRLIDSRVQYSSSTGVTLSGDDLEIYNNVISNVVYLPINSPAGLQTIGSRHTIQYNTVYSCGHAPIVINAKNSLIFRNRSFDGGTTLTDIAGINMYAAGDLQGTRITENISHDHWAIYNSSLGLNGAHGIRCDSNGNPGNSNVKIYKNLVYNTSNESCAIWSLQPGYPNYGNSQIEVFNNTFQKGIYLVLLSGGTFAGTKIENNIAATINVSAIPDGTSISNNLLVYSPLAGNLSGDPKLVSPNNYNYQLQPNSPAIAAGIKKESIAYTGAAPDIGALDYGCQPLIAGAYISQADVANLVFTQDIFNPRKIIVTGFPGVRALPPSATIGVQHNATSNYFYISLDPKTLEVKAVFTLPEFVKNGKGLAIEFSLNPENQPFQNTGYTIDTEGFSVDRVNVNTNTVKITGKGFWNVSSYRIPMQFSNIQYAAAKGNKKITGVADLNPILISLDTKSLISQGKLKADCSNLRTINFDGSSECFQWIESGANKERTLYWIKMPAAKMAEAQAYEDESAIYLEYGNSQVSVANNLESVFPLLAQHNFFLWLSAHDIPSTSNTPISFWPSAQPDGLSVSQSEPKRQPILRSNSLNGFPGLEFDGIDDYLSAESSGTYPQATFWVVYQSSNPGSSTFQRLISTGPSGSKDYEVGVCFQPHLDPANLQIAYPQGVTRTQSFLNKDCSRVHIGTRQTTFGSHYKGTLLQVLATYDKVTSAEIKSIEKNYLDVKYGIAPNTKIDLDRSKMLSPLQVKIGEVICSDVRLVSAFEITATIPDLPSGTYNLTVVNPDGQSYSLADAVVID